MEWDTNNLRMQSLLNNYSLALNDRQALYRSLRTEGQEKTKFMYQMIQFMTGRQDKPKETAKQGPLLKETKNTTPEIKKSFGYEILNEESDVPAKKEVPITEVYLQRALEEAELNESGLSPYPVHHFDRFFAAGMVSSSSFMQSLLCQSYFRPYIIEVVC